MFWTAVASLATARLDEGPQVEERYPRNHSVLLGDLDVLDVIEVSEEGAMAPQVVLTHIAAFGVDDDGRPVEVRVRREDVVEGRHRLP